MFDLTPKLTMFGGLPLMINLWVVSVLGVGETHLSLLEFSSKAVI